MEKHGDRTPTRANGTAFLCEIGDQAAIGKLIEDELDFRVQNTALTVAIGITDQADEQEGEEQGTQEIKGTILIGYDAEVSTLFFPWQFKIDLIVRGDVSDLRCLHNCQLTSEANDNAGSDCLARLLKYCIGSSSRRCWKVFSSELILMLMADTFHHFREALFRFCAEEVIDGGKVPAFRRHFKCHI